MDIDWPSLIDAIIEAGYTQKDVARVVGCDQSHISDLKRGAQAEPKYGVGKKLIDLHLEVVRKDKKRA